MLNMNYNKMTNWEILFELEENLLCFGYKLLRREHEEVIQDIRDTQPKDLYKYAQSLINQTLEEEYICVYSIR